MNATIEDLRPTTLPKSTQLNADQLIVGPMDITVTDVRIGPDEKQSIAVHYANEAGRPFMPCLTMRRVLLAAWGHDGRDWIGKSLRVYHDPHVRFGGDEIGGVRISHMTDIPGQRIELRLTTSKGKKALYTIHRMETTQDSGPTLAHVLQLIAKAAGSDDMKAAKEAAKTLTSDDDIAAAQEAYRLRVAALKKPAPALTPSPALAKFKRQIDTATSAEIAGLVLDEARDTLDASDHAALCEHFAQRWES